MIILAKYATQLILPPFPMIKAGTEDFAQSADWTPATGDCKFSLDGSGVANTSNLPANVGGTNAGLWSLTLTAAELTGKAVSVQIVDGATKAVKDNALLIYTFGHAAAQYPFDLSLTFVAQMITGLTTSLTEAYAADNSAASVRDMLYLIQAALTEFSKSGTAITLKKVDGATTAAVLTLDDATNPTSSTRTS